MARVSQLEPKAGIRTSEFWSAKITQVVLGVFLVARGSGQMDEASGESIAASAPAVIDAFVVAVMGLIELGYTVSRSFIKKTDVEITEEDESTFEGFHGKK